MMGLLKIDKTKLAEEKVKTTPELVDEANFGLFRAKMTLPAAAKHCGIVAIRCGAVETMRFCLPTPSSLCHDDGFSEAAALFSQTATSRSSCHRSWPPVASSKQCDRRCRSRVRRVNREQ